MLKKYLLMNIIDVSYKNLLKKFFDGAILNILLRLKGIIFLPILVNFFSKDEVGAYSLLQTSSALLLGLYTLNMPDASNRIMLGYKTKGREHDILSLVSTIWGYTAISFVVISIFLFPVLYYLLDFESFWFLLFLALLVFAKLLNKISIFVFQVFQRTKIQMFSNLFVEYGMLLIVIALVYFFEVGVASLVLAYVFLMCLSSSYLVGVLRKSYCFNFNISFEQLRKLIKISIFLLPNVYSLLIIQNSDFLIVKYFYSYEDVAEYSFAYSLVGLVAGFSLAINFFWYSSAVVSTDEKLRLLVSKLVYIFPVMLFFVYSVYRVFSEPITNLINLSYNDSVGATNVLVLGVAANVFVQVMSGVLYSRKLEGKLLFAILVGMILNVIANILLVPVSSYVGAALATSLAYFSILSLQFLFVSYALHLSMRVNFVFFVSVLLSISLLVFSFNKAVVWIS